MAKKGMISGYVIAWVVVVLFIILPFYFVLNIIVERGIDVSIDTHSLEHYLLLSRLFYSSKSIFYTDPYTGRTSLEVVDIAKFNEETLNLLFSEESNTKISFKLTLEGLQPIYYNQRLYELIEPIYQKNDAYQFITKNKIVLVKYKDGREEKKLLSVNTGFCKRARCD